jgi:hypothetical protein
LIGTTADELRDFRIYDPTSGLDVGGKRGDIR